MTLTLARARRQVPVLERRAVAQRAGLAHQDRQVVPGVVDHLFALEAARVIGDDLVVQQHDDAVSVSAHQHTTRPAARASTLYLLRSWVIRQVVVARIGFSTESGERVPRTAPGAARSSSNTSQMVLIPELRMPRPLGVGAALVLQPGVQLLQRLDLRGRGLKSTSRIVPTWFSTWPFSQPDAGVQAVGSTR